MDGANKISIVAQTKFKCDSTFEFYIAQTLVYTLTICWFS